MEDQFKRKLLSLRKPLAPKTFAEALMGRPEWHLPIKAGSQAPKLPREQFTEKGQVLNSLERFAKEKSQELLSSSIPVKGGELHIRPEPSWQGIAKAKSVAELKSTLSIDSKIADCLLDDRNPESIKILFVSENFRPWEEISPEIQGNSIDPLLCCFPLKTAELFNRMIAAMKLASDEVCLFAIEEGERDVTEEALKVAAYFGPTVLVTLGAKASNRILKGNDRLSLIHGQFFQREIEGIGTIQVVPLFHPSIIETNQNMKKTAWTDMQKIMKHLKKLP